MFLVKDGPQSSPTAGEYGDSSVIKNKNNEIKQLLLLI